MRARSPKVALGRSSEAAADQLAIGVAGPFEDLGVALVDLLAYAGEVLSEYQDEVADEAYLETDWNEDSRTLHIRLRRGHRPGLCLIADRRRVYVVLVGPNTGEARVVFGDGVVGKRPRGAGEVAAHYRRGAGGTGSLTLSGLRLRRPFVALMTGGQGGYAASESGGCSRRARKTRRADRR
jgi:hypothetical protein